MPVASVRADASGSASQLLVHPTGLMALRVSYYYRDTRRLHAQCAHVIAFQADPRVCLEHCRARLVAAVPVTEDAQLDYDSEDTIGTRARRAVRIAVSPGSHPFNFLFLLGARPKLVFCQ